MDVVDAVIFDPASGRELKTHLELVPRFELTPADIRSGKWQPALAWHFRREALFLAPRACDALLTPAAALGLAFAVGFSMYAGLV